MVKHFNKHVRDKSTKPVQVISGFNPVFPCTVKGVISETYGKYANSDKQATQIIMEFNEFFPYAN